MSEKKITLPSHKNQDWKTVKVETKKINNLLTHISMNIIELNKLIYAGVKLDCAKIRVPRNSKQGWQIRMKTQIRKLW